MARVQLEAIFDGIMDHNYGPIMSDEWATLVLDWSRHIAYPSFISLSADMSDDFGIKKMTLYLKSDLLYTFW